MNKRLFFIMLLAVATTTLNAQFGGPRLVSPEIGPGKSVTFRLHAPGADEVSITGNWMEGWGARETMERNDTGLWVYTTSDLKPEYYTYSFTVNGVKVLDPVNPLTVRDGVNTFSALLVPGDRSRLYANNDVPHGNLEKVWYPSPSLGMERRMYVYTPPGYKQSAGSYPVLYLLHGGGGDEDAWTTLGRTPQILDNLIAEGRARPMIVVMTNGNPGQPAALTEQLPNRDQGPRGGPAGMAGSMFEKSLVEDVIPFMEKNYRVEARKESRAVAGLSMGGLQTITLSYTWPETFAWYGVMGMGIVDMSRFGIEDNFEARKQSLARLRETNPELYWVACGTEDFLYQSVVELTAFLKDQDFPHVYYETGGGHTWDRWRLYLSELAPLLFR